MNSMRTTIFAQTFFHVWIEDEEAVEYKPTERPTIPAVACVSFYICPCPGVVNITSGQSTNCTVSLTCHHCNRPTNNLNDNRHIIVQDQEIWIKIRPCDSWFKFIEFDSDFDQFRRKKLFTLPFIRVMNDVHFPLLIGNTLFELLFIVFLLHFQFPFLVLSCLVLYWLSTRLLIGSVPYRIDLLSMRLASASAATKQQSNKQRQETMLCSYRQDRNGWGDTTVWQSLFGSLISSRLEWNGEDKRKCSEDDRMNDITQTAVRMIQLPLPSPSSSPSSSHVQ